MVCTFYSIVTVVAEESMPVDGSIEETTLVDSKSTKQSDSSDTNAEKVFVDDDFKKTLKNSSQFTVAVFPMQNMSVDGDVAFYFRQRVIERLKAKGYNIADTRIIDEKLYELGVSNAEQIRLLQLQQVLDVAKADGYIFGIIEQAATQNALVYNSYVYTSSLKMQDKSGKLLWLALQERVAKRRFAIDPINAVLDVFLVKSGGDKREAVFSLADRLLTTFPKGPVNVSFSDPLLDQAKEVKANK